MANYTKEGELDPGEPIRPNRASYAHEAPDIPLEPKRPFGSRRATLVMERHLGPGWTVRPWTPTYALEVTVDRESQLRPWRAT